MKAFNLLTYMLIAVVVSSCSKRSDKSETNLPKGQSVGPISLVVNGSPYFEGGQGAPLWIEARISNITDAEISLTDTKKLELSVSPTGAFAQKLAWPENLPAGQTATRVWLAESEIARGDYRVSLAADSPQATFSVEGAGFTIGSDLETPARIASLNRGLKMILSSDLEAVVAELEAAAAASPKRLSLHLEMIRALRKVNDPKREVAAYQRLLKTYPKSAALPIWLAEGYSQALDRAGIDPLN